MTDTAPGTRAITLTRRELFDLIWAKPITQVAADLGISDVGLAKICSRHDVPRPGRGYWACRHAGKAVPPPRFRKARRPELETIVITGTSSAVLEAKAAAKLVVPIEAPPEDVPPEPHPLLAKAAKQLRSARSSEFMAHTIGPTSCGLAFSPSRVERALAFLSRLFRTLDPLGISATAGERSFLLLTDAGEIECRLVEELKTIDYVPTAQEQAREQRRLAQLEDRQAYYRLSQDQRTALHMTELPKFVTVSTQQLSFKIESQDEGLRRIWRDGKRHALEDFLPQIVAGIFAIVAHRKEAELRRRAEESARAERARLQELARKRGEREANRLALLREDISRTAEISGISTWLAAVAGDERPQVFRMAEWARQRLIELESESARFDLAECIERLGLFLEPDPLASSAPSRPDLPGGDGARRRS